MSAVGAGGGAAGRARRARRPRVPLLAAGLTALLLAGCALPLPHDVKTAGGVRGDVRQPDNLRVIPPGPSQGQGPGDVVAGFLGAQASTTDRHAIARAFLTSGESTAWDDRDRISVYSPETLQVQPAEDDGSTAHVSVSATVLGEVGPDGSYAARRSHVTEEYVLTRVGGDWRLSSVPDGLRLTTADLLRAFRAVDVYYLAPLVATDHVPHVVPDRVFLAQGPEIARAAVARMLRPPSASLAGAVSLGLPAGVQLSVRSVTRGPEGIAVVDLGGRADVLSGQQREDLSARLLWTLSQLGSTRLRLLVEGHALAVPGSDVLQDVSAYNSYTPEGLGVDPPYFFVDRRRLRASVDLGRQASSLTAPDLTAASSVGVDEVAVTTDRTQVAVLEHRPGGLVDVHVGPLQGPAYPVVATGTRLASPSWGSGEYGLWMVRDGRDVVVADPLDATLHRVPVDGRLPGPVSSLVVSRDGARAALVAGGQLFVAPVLGIRAAPRLGVPVPLAPALRGATQVVWSSGTELLVLIGGRSPQVQRLFVDGSGLAQVPTGAVAPVRVAAGGGSIVLESGGALYSTRSPVPIQSRGRAPVFPG